MNEGSSWCLTKLKIIHTDEVWEIGYFCLPILRSVCQKILPPLLVRFWFMIWMRRFHTVSTHRTSSVIVPALLSVFLTLTFKEQSIESTKKGHFPCYSWFHWDYVSSFITNLHFTILGILHFPMSGFCLAQVSLNEKSHVNDIKRADVM